MVRVAAVTWRAGLPPAISRRCSRTIPLTSALLLLARTKMDTGQPIHRQAARSMTLRSRERGAIRATCSSLRLARYPTPGWDSQAVIRAAGFLLARILAQNGRGAGRRRVGT